MMFLNEYLSLILKKILLKYISNGQVDTELTMGSNIAWH